MKAVTRAATAFIIRRGGRGLPPGGGGVVAAVGGEGGGEGLGGGVLAVERVTGGGRRDGSVAGEDQALGADDPAGAQLTHVDPSQESKGQELRFMFFSISKATQSF